VTGTDAATAARELFIRTTSQKPEGSWSAPGRVNLIGEHTDYNDGFVLPFAIPHRTHVRLCARADGRIRVVSTFDEVPVEVALDDLDALFPENRGRVPEWSTYPLGVAWAVLRAAERRADSVTGVDIAIASDVPVGAGLSSSAAIEGATAIALDETWGLGLDRVALAQVGRTAENEAVGAPTGIMDQMASMLGEPDRAIFLDCRSLEATVIDLGFAAADLEILVLDTGVKHAHSTGVPALRDLSVDDLPAAQARMDDITFRRVRHIVTENQRVQDTVQTLRASGPRAIGDLLTASHASMRDDFEISVPELDTAVDAALAAGAIGARMTGGGFGGAAIALVDRAHRTAVAASVEAAFAAAGYAAPHIFPVTPSAGAARSEPPR
jgi:galactokinase